MHRRSFVLATALLVSLLVPSRALASSPPLFDSADVLDGELDPADLVGRATVGRATAPSARGHAWLSLLGFARRNQISEQREIGGMLVVNLPLGRAPRPSVGAAMLEPEPAAIRVVTGHVRERAGFALSPRLARDVVGAAWRASGLGADDTRLESIVSRARWSALLPETRLRAVRFEDARLSTDTSSDSERWRDSSGANVGFEARVTWRLDRLLYADDEPSFERMKLERHDARSRIASRALEALFHWQRAWVDLEGIPPEARGTRDEVDAALRVLEAESALDVLTRGWFSSFRARHVTLVVPERTPSEL